VSEIDLGKKILKDFIIILKALELQTLHQKTKKFIKRSQNKNNIERREISDKEIIDRCILALVNEGARDFGRGRCSKIRGYGYSIY